MLEVTDVTFSYAGQASQEPAALAGVSLAVAPGQMVALLGHNGSGKSTLARLMAGVLKPQNGAVTVDGFSTQGARDIWEVRRRVGLVFQHPDDQLVTNTVLDDIAFGPENLGLPVAEIETRIGEVVALLGLEPYIALPISELSIGQKQRVAIAGVLAMRPRYLVLDEPTSMLPSQLAAQLLVTIERLAREQQIGVIYITHTMEEVTGFDRIVVVDHGQIALDGAPRAVFGAPDRMRALGLDVPLTTDLAQRLARRGLPISPETLTEGDLVAALRGAALAGGHIPAADDATSTELPSATPPPSAADVRPILATNDLRYTHLRGTPFAQVGLAGLTLAVPAGAFVAVVGPTRSGKSTLVDCLNGIIRPGRGMVAFEGADIAAPGFDVDALREAVGVVYQSPESQILKDVVGKDIAFGPQRKRLPLATSRRIVQESLEAVGLPYEDFRSRYTYALSGGQQRRVAIAGVLAMQPQVLVLDEPTAGLDPQGRREFLALVRRLHAERGLTVIYLTASLEDVLDLATTIFVLDAGRLAFSGPPRAILQRLPELDALQVGLSAGARLSLALRQLYPDFATDRVGGDELEAEVLRHLRTATIAASESDQRTMGEALL